MSTPRTISFADAGRLSGPVCFSTLVKPVGSACNLDCAYCYYSGKSALYGGRQPVMRGAILEEYVRQYIQANQVDQVTFCWHGGEPLLAGIDYYRTVLDLQNKYGAGKRIVNTIQTNGMLIDHEWCTLWRDNDFLVGISIDGPQDLHDALRPAHKGGGSWAGAMRGLEMMDRYGVEFNTMSVVSALSEGRGAEIYHFLCSCASRFMQFMPAVEYMDSDGQIAQPDQANAATPAPWNISALGYGALLNDIFDQWVKRDVGSRFVQTFDATLAAWVGAEASLCTFAESCGQALNVEHNGDVYVCDHFVYPQYKLGNIMERDLGQIYASPARLHFATAKNNILHPACRGCRYRLVCRGQCPKHRFGADGLNVLCEGYKLFFGHAAPYMDYMARAIEEHMPPSTVMPWARQRMGF